MMILLREAAAVAACGLFFAVWSQCMGNCVVRIAEDKKQEGIKPIRVAKTYIQKNYMTSITLEEMGRITGFNPSYFSLLFKKRKPERILVNIY